MEALKLSENILRMRREKKITQEELADFIGVTKASVSKWETRQSMPDIMLLPQLASFFQVTVDELLGYEPQLSREQIRYKYRQLSEDFAEKPFEEVFARSRELVKKYYACYPFLLQVCVLWLNHFMLAQTQERQKEILEEVIGLCNHILENSKDTGICRLTVNIRAMSDLQCGRPERVIEALEDTLTMSCCGEENVLLVQAYSMAGDLKKADMTVQVDLYQKVQEMLADGIQMMQLHQTEESVCARIRERIEQVIEVFQVGELNPNTVANFYYQAAIVLWTQRKEQETYEQLEKFIWYALKVLEDKIMLHGDSFFYSFDEWIEQQELGAQGVRDKKLVQESIISALENPFFADLPDRKRIQTLSDVIKKRGKKDAHN